MRQPDSCNVGSEIMFCANVQFRKAGMKAGLIVPLAVCNIRGPWLQSKCSLIAGDTAAQMLVLAC